MDLPLKELVAGEHGVLAWEYGILAGEHGVLAGEYGILAGEHGILAGEYGILAGEHGVMAVAEDKHAAQLKSCLIRGMYVV